MKQFFIAGLLTTATLFSLAQKAGSLINVKEVERVERILAADSMEGRRIYTPGIVKAARFISSEFKKAGLKTWNNNQSYMQDFALIKSSPTSVAGTFDGQALPSDHIIAITPQKELKIDHRSGFEIAALPGGSSLMREAMKYVRSGKNYLVIVDKGYEGEFSKLARLGNSLFKSDKSVVFALYDKVPTTFSINVKNKVSEKALSNVVGVLPGKSKKNEYVIFSAHYDHLGTTNPVNGDSVYNGANDDAAGTTAVITLATYFKTLGNNERTIIFAAFTAEEVGGIGSQFFSRQMNADQVVAMFNIEMIGTESKWGRNSAYITGYEKTDMGKIMQENLKGSGFTFYPDPYLEQQLFYRSDNATLAGLGVPAHTISTSKMDDEPNYHQLSDEVKTLDIKNMARIIEAIAISSKTIIGGKDTPHRVAVEDL